MNIPPSLEKKAESAYNYFSHRQYEFQLAWGTFGQITAIFAFEAFAMLLCDKFGIHGWVSSAIYFGMPIAILVLMVWIGNTMIRTGYAHKYMKYGQDTNKDWARMMKTIERMEKYLDEHP